MDLSTFWFKQVTDDTTINAYIYIQFGQKIYRKSEAWKTMQMEETMNMRNSCKNGGWTELPENNV
jgi:hypothetical protein